MLKEKNLNLLHKALGVEIILAALAVIVCAFQAGKRTGIKEIYIDNLFSFLSITTVLTIGILLAICALAFRVTKVEQTLELLLFSGFVITCGVWFLIDFDYMILFVKIQAVVDCLDDLSIGFLPLFGAAYLSMLLQNRRTRLIMRINYMVLLLAQFVTLLFLLFKSKELNSKGVFLFSLILLAVSMLSGACCLIYEALHEKKRRIQMIAAFMVMILIGIWVDTLDYYFEVAEHGYVFHILFLIALCGVIFWMLRYISNSVRQARRTAELEKEVLQSQIAVMLSQIKPHFIFNTLNAISALCLTDPLKADETIITFSEYLRENINALEIADPVPFEQELHHVKNYAKIEQTRFGEKLTMEYHVEFSNFRIPTLTLQPIVENAIRHGIGKKEAPGTVVIHVSRKDNFAEIRVEDDGVGFDMEGNYKRNDSIGMKNVKSRLSVQVDATMEVTSQPGKGTKVVVRIPIKEQDGGRSGCM